jgi:hypothetical protein
LRRENVRCEDVDFTWKAMNQTAEVVCSARGHRAVPEDMKFSEEKLPVRKGRGIAGNFKKKRCFC